MKRLTFRAHAQPTEVSATVRAGGAGTALSDVVAARPAVVLGLAFVLGAVAGTLAARALR